MTSPRTDQHTVADLANLVDLRTCRTRTALRDAWLAFAPVERAELRWNPLLAAHARSVLDQNPA